MDPNEAVIRQYYAFFNECRLDEMEALLTSDAIIEQLPFRGYEPRRTDRLGFARAWRAAFSDAIFTIESLARKDSVYEVAVLATGTHNGALDLGGWVFKATGAAAKVQLRELLEICNGRIVSCSLSFDLQAIVEQLAKVDSGTLLKQLHRIRQLGDELARVQRSSIPAQDVIEQLGRELDAARHTVRPYFKR